MKDNLAPQLPLEAALAERGAFKGLSPASASQLHYVRLRPMEKLKVDTIPADDLAQTAWRELEDMIAEYSNQQKAYVSKARIVKDGERVSDYDHLARYREWSLAEDGGEG